MTPARCDCCDLPESSCGKADEERQRVEQRREQARLRANGYVPATWPGLCASCGEPFDNGALIRVNGVGRGWSAGCCA